MPSSLIQYEERASVHCDELPNSFVLKLGERYRELMFVKNFLCFCDRGK